LKEILERFFERFSGTRCRPREIALGFALGVFIGFTPFMGFQTAAGVLAAAWLRGSKIAAALGVQVTNVVTAPVIYGFTYFVGTKVLFLERPVGFYSPLSLDLFLSMLRQAPEIMAALVAGGVVVGAPVALVSYFAVHRLASRRRYSPGTGCGPGGAPGECSGRGF
jgi:uncharacterized protein (DUF2062 family)